MRSLQRHPLTRLLSAAAAGSLLTLVARRAGPAVAITVLFLALTAVAFVALTLVPDAIALQRRHYWGSPHERDTIVRFGRDAERGDERYAEICPAEIYPN